MTNAELIKKYMNKYACTEAEARSMIEWDEDETMETEETKRQAENFKKFSRSHHDAHTFVKRERKPREIKLNPTKVDVIAGLAEKLTEMGMQDVEITNVQKYITFTCGDEKFELNLVRKNLNLAKKKGGAK